MNDVQLLITIAMSVYDDIESDMGGKLDDNTLTISCNYGDIPVKVTIEKGNKND